MLGAVVNNVLVDFIGNAISVPAHTEVADEFEFRAGEYLARGIVGRVENDGFGVRAEGGGQFFFVEGPVGSAQLDKAWSRAAENRVGAVILVERLEDDDFIAGIDDGHHRGHHGFG